MKPMRYDSATIHANIEDSSITHLKDGYWQGAIGGSGDDDAAVNHGADCEVSRRRALGPAHVSMYDRHVG